MICPSVAFDYEYIFYKRVQQVGEQFKSIKSIIEDIKPSSVMDIGSGFAVIDVFICRYSPIKQVHLIDGDGTPRLNKVAFHEDTQAWNDVNIGVEIVRANVSNDVKITGHYADPVNISVKVDLVISCRSWGHHYPISIYADTVKRCLNLNGYVITDVRNNTNGLEQLEAIGFEVIQQIQDPSLKCKRWLLRNIR